MKIKITLTTLILSLLLTGSNVAQDPKPGSGIQGNWESVLKLGDLKLRLVLKIRDGQNGQLQALLDSPDQDATDLEVDSITLENNVLRFTMKKLYIFYEGTLNPATSEITGTFNQAGNAAPLLFRKEGAAVSTATVKRGSVQLKPCNNPSLTSDALCVKYEVFENRATRTGRRIPLNIILLPAKNPKPAPDPLFYLAGGPGAAATGYAEASFMAGLRRNRDVVLVDQRGTGESNPLNCAPFGSREDMRGYFGEQFPVEKIRACRTELEKVADLKLYTTAIAMDDLDEVRAALGYDRINVYGGSYGSTTSLVYLRQHGDHVRSVAIFGVAPPAAKIPLSFARGVQDAVNRMFADCAADQTCKTAYPSLEADLKTVLARFDKGPVEIDVPNVFTQSSQKVTVTRDAFVDGIRQMLYVPNAAAALPALIHMGAGGDLSGLVGTAFQVVSQIDAKISRGMQLSVICAEDTPFITAEDIKTTSANSFYGDARVRPTMKACAEWPQPKVDASFLDPVKSDLPVLLVSGELDPVTPPWLAQIVAKTLSRSKLVVVPNATHNSYECIENVVADFIDKGSAEGLDVTCTEKIKRPPFTILKNPQ
ncbi:MAG TPA: alpha/beta hydrolase [Pyrinomonadaceae bacterium]|nr:alpha/beta hydrolase [Pyrinomonadaceae bacterium]